MLKKRPFNVIGVGFNAIALVVILVSVAEGSNKSLYVTFAILMFIAVCFYLAALFYTPKF